MRGFILWSKRFKISVYEPASASGEGKGDASGVSAASVLLWDRMAVILKTKGPVTD